MKQHIYLPIIVFALLVLAPLLAPLAQPGTLHQFDTILHLERIVAFYRALSDHSIPPSWSIYLSYGFGSPVLIYNWSFPYYIASLFLSLHLTLVDTYKWLTAITYILAFAWMFIFVATFTKSRASALVAAAWYVWAPYRFNINQLRGAIGEEFSTAFWPGVFWATVMLFHKRYTLGFFTGALLWSVTLWSHPPMFAMIVPLWLLFTGLYLRETRNIRAAIVSLSTLITGMGIVAYSWVPILFERGWLYYGVHEAIYPDNFVRWSQLLSQPDFYEFNLQLGPTRYFVFYSIGWAFIAAGILTAYALVIHSRKLTRMHVFALLFLGMGIFGVFLLRPASALLWAYLPLLAPTMVFPQRFLGLIMFCGSVLGGLYISRLNKRHVWTGAILSIVTIMFLNYPYLTLNKYREPDLAKLNNPVLTTTDVWGEFSPKWIPADFQLHGPMLAKHPIITITPVQPKEPLCTQTSVSITCVVDTKGAATIGIRQFYFPGWVATADGIDHPITKNTDGTMNLVLTGPTQTIRLVFGQTPARKFSLILSAVCTVLYLFFGAKAVYTHMRKKHIHL